MTAYFQQNGAGQVLADGVSGQSLYIALVSDASIAKGAAFSDLTEIAAAGAEGYARQTLVSSDWTASNVGASDAKVTSGAKTFTCAGTWKSAGSLAVVNSDAGAAGLKLYGTADLSTTRSLVSGDSLQLTGVSFTLQG